MSLETLFHPYAAEFQRRLNRGGLTALLSIASQQTPTLPALLGFDAAYGPTSMVAGKHPRHEVDFGYGGAYSQYNWEIFFHAPLLIASRLVQNQRFEEAMDWFHFIFDPTQGVTGDPSAARFWQVLPFRTTAPERLDALLTALHSGDPETLAQWEDAQAHPFQPHRVARLRHEAYQKAVVMKYIDMLIAWGDHSFRMETLEKINEATQLYVMAAHLLGRLPERMQPRGRSEPLTYAQLRPRLDKIGEAIVQAENDVPYASTPTLGEGATESVGLLGMGSTWYFCIPQNDRLLGYWDTVADRLFKIRHSLNIEGVARQLPLFESPIDPALLVSAAAQGLDLNSVLADVGAPLPAYRFTTMLAKALELTAELRSLGSALLTTMEKRDAERLAVLRAGQETDLLRLVKEVRSQQSSEAQSATEGLRKAREVTQARFDFYENAVQRIGPELSQLAQLDEAKRWQGEAQSAEATASDITNTTHDISVGVNSGTPGGGPTFSATLGRGNVIAYFQALSRNHAYQASIHTNNAGLSSILGGWSRRADDWKLQASLASKELAQIDKQIAAAQIREAIADRELSNTEHQIEQSLETQDFLRNKFTGEELYGWMQGEIQTIFFQCHQMAYDLAKQAERSCRFELGQAQSNFIKFGTWDSARKGLLAGERLYLQLKQLERAYLNANRRDFELTKHYSMVMNDPQDFVKLKAQGWCEIDLPEALFDADYPGHYMRRIKNVAVTIPAVIGPYSGINATLRLLKDTTRVKNALGDGYGQREGEEDDRFLTSWVPTHAIATSTGQNDSGMFEVTFRDERYLPFEGAGAVSRWRVELDARDNNFDPRSLSDLILHIHYTARDGGDRLKAAARAALAEAIGEEAARPQARLFSLKHEFGPEWYRLTRNATQSTETFVLGAERFPFLFRGSTITTRDLFVYAVLKPGAEPVTVEMTVTPPGGDATEVKLEPRKNWNGLLAPQESIGSGITVAATPEDAGWVLETGAGGLPKQVDDLLVVCNYEVTNEPV